MDCIGIMVDVFNMKLVVPAEAIDGNNHVNNLEYIRWTLRAAIAHSDFNGWTVERYREIGAGWVVRSHNFTYFRPAFLGDEVVVKTWVSEMAKVRSKRKYLIIRPANNHVLCRGETEWAFVNDKGRPVAIPKELSDSFPIVAGDGDMP